MALVAALGLLLLSAAPAAAAQAPAAQAPAVPPPTSTQRLPNVLLLTIDTLRADRLSAYGYRRPTSPRLDRLMAEGVRFAEARTVEPLTGPSMASLLTSTYPHEHGATRNGLRLRPGMASFARQLGRRGYKSAAFVGNWTLRQKASGLGEHFQTYDEVFTRKRWFGLFKGEATAEDLTDSALAWLGEHLEGSRRPFLLWVHYVEPHAPYRLHEEEAERLGLLEGSPKGDLSKSDRYDTEVAFVDREAGRLLDRIAADPALAASTLIVFAADHGEALGEHGDWGHGRNLYEPALRVPLALTWPGRLKPRVVRDPAVLLDVGPTVLGLAGLPAPQGLRGFDWTPVLLQGAAPPKRVTFYQAHKGAVLSAQEAGQARRRGLLEIGRIEGTRKEVYRPGEKTLRVYDLASDPGETRNLAEGGAESRAVVGAGVGAAVKSAAPPLSAALRDWLASVHRGLADSDRLAPPDLDAESLARLRALGYAE